MLPLWPQSNPSGSEACGGHRESAFRRVPARRGRGVTPWPQLHEFEPRPLAQLDLWQKGTAPQ